MSDDYVITQISDTEYDVYKEGNGEPYHVSLIHLAETCNCPHWVHRLRQPGRRCKHIKLVYEQGAWNQRPQELNPIKVYCEKCDRWINENAVEFNGIEEDIQGKDVLSFGCPHCGTRQKSWRVATR